MQCQKQLSPVVGQRTLSQTSMDSTGSSHMDTESSRATTTDLPLRGGEGGGREVGTAGNAVVQTNGHCEEEEEEEEEESCDNHVASPDSGHVTSPDPASSFSPPPALDEMLHIKKKRSNSTEIAPSSLHSREQNGDQSSPNLSDEVFNQSTNKQGSPSSSDQSSPQGQGRGETARLIRRKTVPAKLHPQSSPRNRGTRTSVISHAPSYGTSRKGYTNVAGTPTIPLSAVPLGSKLLSVRRGSMSLPKKKKMVPLVGTGSPIHTNSPKLRVLKVVLAGNDQLVCHAGKAYAHLLTEEPNLLSGLDVRFYHVPLSAATTADWSIPERNTATNGRDSPDTLVGEQPNSCGFDVCIGRYMSHLDSWYERNVALAVHHSLRLLPPITGETFSLLADTQHTRPPVTPAKVGRIISPLYITPFTSLSLSLFCLSSILFVCVCVCVCFRY